MLADKSLKNRRYLFNSLMHIIIIMNLINKLFIYSDEFKQLTDHYEQLVSTLQAEVTFHKVNYF